MNSPIGIATSMAKRAISKVPRNTGIAPNAPDPRLWSARSAICGSQLSPKKKSKGDTIPKNRSASISSETTMPRVVRIAMTEAATMKALITALNFLELCVGQRRQTAIGQVAALSERSGTGIFGQELLDAGNDVTVGVLDEDVERAGDAIGAIRNGVKGRGNAADFGAFQLVLVLIEEGIAEYGVEEPTILI